MGADSGDHFLQIIAVLAGHANFLALNLGGDLELLIANELRHLLGDCGLDTLLDLDDLAGVAEGGDVRLFLLHGFQTDVPLGELAHHDLSEGLHLKGVVGGKFDLVFIQDDLGLAALEIEAVDQLLVGNVDGILDFHRVHLRDDIE